MRKIFVFILLLFCSRISFAEYDPVLNDKLEALDKDPESISTLALGDVVKTADYNSLVTLSKLLSQLRVYSIRRSTVKEYFIPLQIDLIKRFIQESVYVKEIALGRKVDIARFDSLTKSVSNRDIYKVFQDLMILSSTLSQMPQSWVPSMNNVYYGNMHYIERKLFDEELYMQKVDPYPQHLFEEISKDCIFHTDDIFHDAYSSLLYKVKNNLFNPKEYEGKEDKYILLSTYTNTYESSLFLALFYQSFFRSADLRQKTDKILSVYKTRYGGKMPNSILSLMQLIFSDMDTSAIVDFNIYRDSLKSEKLEFANYLPNLCPDTLKKHEKFNAYNDRYYVFMSSFFHLLVPFSESSYFDPWGPQVYSAQFGVNSQKQFIRLFAKETFERYYNRSSYHVMSNIEDLFEYCLKNNSVDVDIILQLIDFYHTLNPKRILPLVSRSLVPWFENRIKQNVPENLFKNLLIASTLADYYAAFFVDAGDLQAKKYIKYVEDNLDAIPMSSRSVIKFHVASAYNSMGAYSSSVSWLSDINLEQDEFRSEILSLNLNNYYSLDDYENFMQTLKLENSLSIIGAAQLLYYSISHDKVKKMKEYVELFLKEINFAYNEFIFLNFSDQSWYYNYLTFQTEDVLYDTYLSLQVLDFIHDKKCEQKKDMFSSVLYNWALASKGALLRSLNEAEAIVENKLSEEEVQKLKAAIYIDEKNNPLNTDSASLVNQADIMYSEKVKRSYVDIVRTGGTIAGNEFDYKSVREQLKKDETAVEFIHLGDCYFALILKSTWEYPKYIPLLFKDGKQNDLYDCIWKELVPYFTPGDNVYFSLDDALNKINVELLENENGEVMTEKYNLIRLSSTMNLANDVYSSQVESIVLYGNLLYSSAYNPQRMLGKDFSGYVMPFWNPLPDTKKEIQYVKQAFPGANLTCYEGKKGSKNSFLKLSKSHTDVLHLATHAFYWPYAEREDGEEFTAMERSGLVLSDSGVDYYYTKNSKTVFSNEIALMDLSHVRLLVLSACETGNGELSSDGMLGLQRGFKQAGVGTIIMSLSAVDSNTTTLFMNNFYKNFVAGLSARHAFQKAQLFAKQHFTNEDWKSFIILD